MKQLSLPEQDQMLNQIYGSDLPSANLILLNVILALEDIDRFNSSAFELWLSSSTDVTNTRNKGFTELLGVLGYHAQGRQDLCRFLEQQGLAASSALWAYRASIVVPDWSRLIGDGPWLKDSRASLFADFLQSNGAEEGYVDRIQAARVTFRAALGRHRKYLPGAFLPRLLLLVEGPTEVLLIPHFARTLGFDLSSNAVAVVPAGGSNQVVRKYLELRQVTTLPLVVALDADAGAQARLLAESMRQGDRLHILPSGEIEDTFDLKVLKTYLNYFIKKFKLIQPVVLSDFKSTERRTVTLDRLWRERGLGDFDKIGFARDIVEHEMTPDEVPADARLLVQILKLSLEK